MFFSAPAADAGPLAAGPAVQPTVEDLLARHDALIARIKLCFGLDRPTFAREILPLIRAYADFVHWLPATADDFFDRPGGLFQLGLETAFYGVQGTDAYIFSGRLTISARRHLEPRWRRATFIAGLCSELHRALGAVEVLDESGAAWPPLLCPLSSWLETRRHTAWRLRWRPRAEEARSLGLLALPQIVPTALVHHLAEDNELIVPHLLASIGGLPLYRGHNVLDELVRRAFALVVERDLQAQGKPATGTGHGGHQTRYLVDGLQRLIAGEPAWRPNQEKSRVWYARDGLYLIWPGAAHDLYRLLEGEQIAGMPDAPEAILARLLDAGLIQRPSEDETTWRIQPPAANAPLPAIKLASPAVLLRGLEAPVEPLGDPLAVGARAAPAPAPDRARADPAQETPSASNETTAPAPPAGSTTSHAPHWQLKAPLRLSAAVRHALAAILARPADEVAPWPSDDALFVPLHRFEAQGIAPAIAIRALSELDMLALEAPDAPPTARRDDPGGTEVIGIRLKARFVERAASPLSPPLSAPPTC
ncbi:MobH family relaxase [Xanthomonas hortorum]|uniref:TraI domain-containing protein n=1 Tax=Xanthomonas hortorum pv. hederae TaxID=453603 RepID=A0A9X3YZ89_9XANT|nr:MobH family relaxase [Xanthomonas hortorum]MCE4369680.1 TraI domain-containing protein [Xanthomonas hortorum pv. hederae]MDC8637178.1 TraI domain-containing protein [Xanthomonas hortorum pv. hederae]PPU86220.1 hypothetical protein XhhCFBP4925_00365 [Xanthomonas hortorum pv. hederae]PUF01347.1 relaxase [Xanthomonas hortorum pv. hederae]